MNMAELVRIQVNEKGKQSRPIWLLGMIVDYRNLLVIQMPKDSDELSGCAGPLDRKVYKSFCKRLSKVPSCASFEDSKMIMASRFVAMMALFPEEMRALSILDTSPFRDYSRSEKLTFSAFLIEEVLCELAQGPETDPCVFGALSCALRSIEDLGGGPVGLASSPEIEQSKARMVQLIKDEAEKSGLDPDLIEIGIKAFGRRPPLH